MKRAVLRASLALVVALVLIELGWRALGRGPTSYASRRVEPAGYGPFLRTPQGLLVYAPHASWTFVYDAVDGSTDPLRVSHRINAFGLRDAERAFAKPPGALRVICLGDSFTFGEGVRVEDAYPALLERRLGDALAPRAVEVWNAGVQAYGTAEAIALFESRLLAAAPDVVTLCFFLNDATDFERTIAEFTAALEPAPLSWAARISRVVEAWERGRHARSIAERFVATTRASLHAAGFARCEAGFRRLRELADGHGFRALVLVFPALMELDGDYPFEEEHALVAAALERAGLETLDLLPAFRGLDARVLRVHPTDHHPNARAHAIAAELVAERLLADR